MGVTRTSARRGSPTAGPASPVQGAGGGGEARVRVELSLAHVRALMESGVLRAEGMRCLDAGSKEMVRRLCLECCAARPPVLDPALAARTDGLPGRGIG